MENKKKIHWIAKEKLCIPIKDGGLGFKDIQLFNQALLAKKAWRFMQFPNCLMVLFLKSRYCGNLPFLQGEVGKRPSFAWRSILHGRILLNEGIRQMVGDGCSLRVWTSPWLQDGRLRAPLMKNILVDLKLRVKDLIDFFSKSWKLDVLDDLFFQRDVDLIKQIKPVVSSPDFWCWIHKNSGDYSVRSGYWLSNQIYRQELLREARMQPSLNGLKDQVWKSKNSSKIKTFLWKVLSGAIPMADKMVARGMKTDSRS